ncbi:hypothetical protein [uncultured Shewanella sp.]|uniref:hypothetical protein n=1 Tax=uncultured Shewanella sp. TaxID=173975 RepID=UPI0026395595|nr:hypothetical protein [uncultured Shewanella sp.]
MNNEEGGKGAPSAEELYQQSMSLIDEAIKSCGIEGFEGAALMIPQVIQGNEVNANPIPQLSDQTFFHQAENLFGSQENLFSEQQDVQQEAASVKEENTRKEGSEDDPGLNSITDMFNAI